MALARRQHSLCRQFEKEKGLFAHKIQVGVYGDAALDRRRWVCVLPRYGSAYHTTNEDCLSMTLYVFRSVKTTMSRVKVDLSKVKPPVRVRTQNGWIVFLVSVLLLLLFTQWFVSQGPLANSTSSSLSRSSNLVFVFGSDRYGKYLMDQFLNVIHRAQTANVDTSEESELIVFANAMRENRLFVLLEVDASFSSQSPNRRETAQETPTNSSSVPILDFQSSPLPPR